MMRLLASLGIFWRHVLPVEHGLLATAVVTDEIDRATCDVCSPRRTETLHAQCLVTDWENHHRAPPSIRI